MRARARPCTFSIPYFLLGARRRHPMPQGLGRPVLQASSSHDVFDGHFPPSTQTYLASFLFMELKRRFDLSSGPPSA